MYFLALSQAGPRHGHDHDQGFRRGPSRRGARGRARPHALGVLHPGGITPEGLRSRGGLRPHRTVDDRDAFRRDALPGRAGHQPIGGGAPGRRRAKAVRPFGSTARESARKLHPYHQIICFIFELNPSLFGKFQQASPQSKIRAGILKVLHAIQDS